MLAIAVKEGFKFVVVETTTDQVVQECEDFGEALEVLDLQPLDLFIAAKKRLQEELEDYETLQSTMEDYLAFNYMVAIKRIDEAIWSIQAKPVKTGGGY